MREVSQASAATAIHAIPAIECWLPDGSGQIVGIESVVHNGKCALFQNEGRTLTIRPTALQFGERQSGQTLRTERLRQSGSQCFDIHVAAPPAIA
ncbi:hypothetical protein C6V05_16650 [Burkholderia multivorans]|nr:hypothetical protein C6V05_16650 [Burkholderia multivorans]